MRKSLLLRFLEWIQPYLTDNFIGWIWAANSILYLFSIPLGDGKIASAIVSGICFLIACRFWVKSDNEKEQ